MSGVFVCLLCFFTFIYPEAFIFPLGFSHSVQQNDYVTLFSEHIYGEEPMLRPLESSVLSVFKIMGNVFLYTTNIEKVSTEDALGCK